MTSPLVQLVIFPYYVRPEDASHNRYTQQKHVNDKLRSEWWVAGVAPLVLQSLEGHPETVVPALSMAPLTTAVVYSSAGAVWVWYREDAAGTGKETVRCSEAGSESKGPSPPLMHYTCKFCILFFCLVGTVKYSC